VILVSVFLSSTRFK